MLVKIKGGMAASYRACRPGGCAAKQGPLRCNLIYVMASSMGAAPARISHFY